MDRILNFFYTLIIIEIKNIGGKMNNTTKFIIMMVIGVIATNFLYENIYTNLGLNIWLARGLGVVSAAIIGAVSSKILRLDEHKIKKG